ncbi:MAG: hypothetical protein A4E28_01261 [Methanocella sp. PtaU1.Bin125]|nr:MAG: hypothetical protein A4E28_01261 [Methanocella sp. PtaU1.Bin125]
MLKKTAAIAVLVLMIASLFSGSPGPVQAEAPEKTVVGHMINDFHWPPFSALHVVNALSRGTSGSSGGMAGGMAADSPAAGFAFAGVPAGDGMVVAGRMSLDSPGQAYTSMIVYMNDSRMKFHAFGPDMFRDRNDSQRDPWPVPRKLPRAAFEPGALSIDGKIAMFRTGSAVPDMFDLRWENIQVVRFGEQMSPAIFSAHLVIPSENGSREMSPADWPFPGEYVLDSDIAVDLANLTFESDVPSPDSVYNNQISAGETRWHCADISDAVESVNIDLKWREGSHPLKLTIYTPDGHVLGPYEDSADGRTDGRINLNVAGPSGVAAGEWSLKVTDTGGTGVGAYYVKTY